MWVYRDISLCFLSYHKINVLSNSVFTIFYFSVFHAAQYMSKEEDILIANETVTTFFYCKYLKLFSWHRFKKFKF